MIRRYAPLDLLAVEALLCDADGTLFASEEPALDASTIVTNRRLRELGIDVAFTPQELRRRAVGRNFARPRLVLEGRDRAASFG